MTLWELLVVVALVAIVAGAAMPTWRTAWESSRAAAWEAELRGALGRARQYALVHGTPVTLCGRDPDHAAACAAGGGWSHGWRAFEDPQRDGGCIDNDGDGHCDGHGGRILAAAAPPGAGLAVVHNHLISRRIRIDEDGLTPGHAGRLTACRGADPVAGIVIATTGRVRPAEDGDYLACSP